MDVAEIESLFFSGEEYLKNVLVDNVIFGYHHKELKVLLQQPFVLDGWTVTGGYIKKNRIDRRSRRPGGFCKDWFEKPVFAAIQVVW